MHLADFGKPVVEVRHSSNPARDDSFSEEDAFPILKSTDGWDDTTTTSTITLPAGAPNNWLIGGRNDPLIDQNRDDVEQLVKAILSNDGGSPRPDPAHACAPPELAQLWCADTVPRNRCSSEPVESFLFDLHTFLESCSSILNSSSGNSMYASSAIQKHAFPVINRWRNIDLDLPILIPGGTLSVRLLDGAVDQFLCASSAKISVDYLFDNTAPREVRHVCESSKIMSMFSANVDGGPPTKVASNLLCTRLAVLHKCPDFLLPLVAKALLVTAKSSTLMDKPIHLSCTKISRCSVSQKFSLSATPEFGWCERVEALMEPASQHDEAKLSHLSSILGIFAYLVNDPIASIVSTWYRKITNPMVTRSIPPELFNPNTGHLALAFKWAPSKQMKVLLATRATATSTSLQSKRLDCKGFQSSEIRLEHERRNDKQWDPTLLAAGYRIPCKKLIQTPEGDEARVVLCPADKVLLPKVRINL